MKKEDYVKSSFIYERDKVTQCVTWTVVEDQIDPDSDKVFKDIYEQMVIIIHPMFSTSIGDETKEIDAKKATSDTIVDSSSTRPPTEILPASSMKAEAVTEFAKDHSPDEAQVNQYLEQEQQEQQEEEANYDFDELPPLFEEKEIDQADL